MSKTARLSEVDALIDDLAIDAYGDEEQLAAFLVGSRRSPSGRRARVDRGCRSRSRRG